MHLIVFPSNFIHEYGHLNFISPLPKKNFSSVYLFNTKENVWLIVIQMIDTSVFGFRKCYLKSYKGANILWNFILITVRQAYVLIVIVLTVIFKTL